MSSMKQLKSGDAADNAHNIREDDISRNGRAGHDIPEVYVAAVHSC